MTTREPFLLSSRFPPVNFYFVINHSPKMDESVLFTSTTDTRLKVRDVHETKGQSGRK